MTRTPPTLDEMLAALVSTPSVSSTRPENDMGNRQVIELLADWLLELGFSTEVLDVPGREDKANLIATLGHGSEGLVLAGHTDTVPVNESAWQSDPFTLEQRDERYYGLGTTDMKSFFALAIEAARPFLREKLSQPLILLATADEESTMSGARALAELGKPKARYAVIGEPTGMQPIHMHKGILMEKVLIRGTAGHSSNPGRGNSALDAMHQVVGELMALRTQWQRELNHAFEVPHPTLNLGCIHGGDNPNRICGAAELQFDVRLLPGMENAAVRAEIQKRMETVARSTGTEITCEALFGGVQAWQLEKDSLVLRECEALTGKAAGTVAFATEAPFLSELGMETVVIGAGDIEQAHQPDEYLARDRVAPMVDLLQNLIRRFCVNPQ